MIKIVQDFALREEDQSTYDFEPNKVLVEFGMAIWEKFKKSKIYDCQKPAPIVQPAGKAMRFVLIDKKTHSRGKIVDVYGTAEMYLNCESNPVGIRKEAARRIVTMLLDTLLVEVDSSVSKNPD